MQIIILQNMHTKCAHIHGKEMRAEGGREQNGHNITYITHMQ